MSGHFLKVSPGQQPEVCSISCEQCTFSLRASPTCKLCFRATKGIGTRVRLTKTSVSVKSCCLCSSTMYLFSQHTEVLQHLPHFVSGFEPSMTDPSSGRRLDWKNLVPLQLELSCGSVSDPTGEMLAWSQAGFEIGTFTWCSLNMKLGGYQ